ncbi:MAG: hypothetical protein ABI877_01610 [Gemmatimonadaceae bacterium]
MVLYGTMGVEQDSSHFPTILREIVSPFLLSALLESPMMKRSLRFAPPLALAGLLAVAPVVAQTPPTEAPTLPLLNQATDPMLRGFRWRSIGPAGQGGRVDDIAVVERDPQVYYIGFATGGIWKTTNNGVTYETIFDSYSTHSIGDIAIAASNPDILYVGTGEANNRQSSSFGDGVFKSIDAGKTWTQSGLRETQSIARVVVHPRNPDVVWVAALGHLFGPNADRGVYKSSDGGKSWRNVLFVDENTGATDLVVSQGNPNVLFAATYTRRRTVWGFASGSPTSGIWKSTDGGERWTRLAGNGLPNGTMGRIGLDVSRSNPNVVYAQIEVAPDKEPLSGARPPVTATAPAPEAPGAPAPQQRQPADDKISGVWRSRDAGRTWEFRSNENNRPMYYSQIRVDPNEENTVYVGGAPASKSTDGGQTFRQMPGMGHVDNHAIWIDPGNSRHVMYGNDGSVDVTWDAGETWESLRTWAVGQSYHASVDMRRPYFVCTGLQDNGSWCGPSSVRGGPVLAQDWYRVGGGDGFYTAVDPEDWTTMYSESQDGNMSRLDLRGGTTTAIRPRPGGRLLDSPPAGQGGAPSTSPRPNVVPESDAPVPLRFNWNTPVVLSPHGGATIYAAGNRLFISRDKGATWTMTQDLTKQVNREDRQILGMPGTLPNCTRLRVGPCIHSKNDGAGTFSNAISFGESPIMPGVLWVGTDDGNIQVSEDGGTTWTEVGRNIPGGGIKEYYVSRVEPSHFEVATAYVSVDGHKGDDLKPYVYVTRDFGKSWTSISADLPAAGNVNTVRQDPRNRNLLYVGTEFGFYVSLDEGKSWKSFMTGLPVVRIDDVLVHPRDNDLVLSTHGRSIWIMDDISALQQMNADAPGGTTGKDVVLFDVRNAVLWKSDIRMRRAVTGSKNFLGESAPPGTTITYSLSSVPAGDVKISITDLATGEVFRTMNGTKLQGTNRVQWNLCSDPRPVQLGQSGGAGGCGAGGAGGAGGQVGAPRARTATAGAYKVTLTVNGKTYEKGVSVLDDVWMM